MGSGQPPPPLKHHKNIGFLIKTGPDPLNNCKASSQHSKLFHHRPASETLLNGRTEQNRTDYLFDVNYTVSSQLY